MKKISIVIAYFGKTWPAYFQLYCDSLKNNPLLDVLLFTDIEEEIPGKPRNLIVRKMDLPALKNLITSKTGIRTNFSGTRKLCDFKPTYGHVFEDYLAGYDFWGYGDIDVIYGNLSKFITDEILKLYDIITFREDWISGAFTLVRNNQTGKLLYRKSADYLPILESPRHYAFDECINKYDRLRDREDILKITDGYQCWTYVCYKAQAEGAIKIFAREYIKESLPFDEVLTYAQQAVLGSGHKHYALYHLVSHKSAKEHHIPQWERVPQQYYITPVGIYSKLGYRYSVNKCIRNAKEGIIQFIRKLKGKP